MDSGKGGVVGAVCSVCAKPSYVTQAGLVRKHLVPVELTGRGIPRPTCEGSGLPPAEPVHTKAATSPAAFEHQWEPEVNVLALAYNEMHTQLCSRGKFCSEHQPAHNILDAARQQRDSLRSTVSAYSDVAEEDIRQLGDV